MKAVVGGGAVWQKAAISVFPVVLGENCGVDTVSELKSFISLDIFSLCGSVEVES